MSTGRYVGAALLGLLVIFPADHAPATNPQPESASLALTKGAQKWVEETLKRLSLGEKVGQMLQVRCYPQYQSFEGADYGSLRKRLQEYHVGSVVVGLRYSRQGLERATPGEAARTFNRLQSDSKLPLLVAADLERGMASRLTDVPDFPWPMAFGALGDADGAERFGSITARQARAVGINWALAPVADVNSNPANPVINDRSFGEDPQQVGPLVAAFIGGAHKDGLLVTAKHFPGNGDTAVDSHAAIALVDATLEHLESVEFPPFEAAIAAGADAILLAHARVPALDPDPDKITTVSSKVVSELLEHKLGFNGLVLTDALEMRGLTTLYQARGNQSDAADSQNKSPQPDVQRTSPTAQAAVDAIRAGCDMIMVPTDLDGAFHSIIRAVQTGEIPESRIDESVRKVLRMKAWAGLDRSRLVDLARVAALTGNKEDLDFAQRAAEQAVTLVRHNGSMLPLREAGASEGKGPGDSAVGGPGSPAGAPSVIRQNTGVRPRNGTPAGDAAMSAPGPQARVRLVAVVLGEALDDASGRELEKALKARCPDAQIFRFDGRVFFTSLPVLLDTVRSADEVVVAAYVSHSGTRQARVNGAVQVSYGLLGPTGRLLHQILAAAGDKTAVIALGSPYLIESFPEIQTYICTYAMASTSEISAVKALFGEIQNHAKLPVTLPGIAARGFSMPWPTKPGRRLGPRPDYEQKDFSRPKALGPEPRTALSVRCSFAAQKRDRRRRLG
jgi:beta-N-acetylhexosaminidase